MPTHSDNGEYTTYYIQVLCQFCTFGRRAWKCYQSLTFQRRTPSTASSWALKWPTHDSSQSHESLWHYHSEPLQPVWPPELDALLEDHFTDPDQVFRRCSGMCCCNGVERGRGFMTHIWPLYAGRPCMEKRLAAVFFGEGIAGGGCAGRVRLWRCYCDVLSSGWWTIRQRNSAPQAHHTHCHAWTTQRFRYHAATARVDLCGMESLSVEPYEDEVLFFCVTSLFV